MLRRNMANSSEKGDPSEKIYEYKKKYYRVIENAEFHARLESGKLEIIKLPIIFSNLTILPNNLTSPFL